MAHLDTRSTSLLPAPPPPKPAPAPKQDPLLPTHCDWCAGRLKGPKGRGARRRTDSIDVDGATVCLDCAKFFGEFDGYIGMPGCTNLSHADTVARMEKVRKEGYGMVLINRTFSAPDGTQLTVELGDVFKLQLPASAGRGGDSCDRQRTQAAFTVTAAIGPYPLTLFLHEVSPISFLEIMNLRAAGELEEAYVAQDDEIGHFRPTPALRAAIDAAYGPR